MAQILDGKTLVVWKTEIGWPENYIGIKKSACSFSFLTFYIFSVKVPSALALWSPLTDSNRRPAHYKCAALAN